jgi:hypothetical protein
MGFALPRRERKHVQSPFDLTQGLKTAFPVVSTYILDDLSRVNQVGSATISALSHSNPIASSNEIPRKATFRSL